MKARFIDPAPPGTPIAETVEWTEPDGSVKKKTLSRIYIRSTVFDNSELLRCDPDYVRRLAALPDAERRALLFGDWDSFAGQVFLEWRDDPAHYADRVRTHVIDPFEIPADWRIWCGLDWGYSRPFSVGWYAVAPDRRLYRVRELYGCTGTPNEGVKWEPGRLAREIRAVEAADPNLAGREIRRVGDPAIWGSDGTESIGALMERERVYFLRGENARLDGKMQVHNRLAFDASGRPMLYVFRTCRNLIRTLPALVYDAANVEDVDTRGEDHAYDELRYVCMANPIPAPLPAPRVLPTFDPLS